MLKIRSTRQAPPPTFRGRRDLDEENPLNHCQDIDDDDVDLLYGQDPLQFKRDYDNFVKVHGNGDKAKTKDAFLKFLSLGRRYKEWLLVYRSLPNCREYCKARLFDAFTPSDPSTVTEQQFVAHVTRRALATDEHLDPGYLRYTYSALYGLFTKKMGFYTESKEEVVNMLAGIAGRVDTALPLLRTLSIVYDDIAMFVQCIDQGVPCPSSLVEALLRMLDELAISYVKSGHQEADDVEVSLPLDGDIFKTEIIPAEEYTKEEGDVGVLLTSKSEFVEPEGTRPSFMVTQTEELAQHHFSAYAEYTTNDGCKCYASFAQPDYSQPGIRVAIGLGKIKIPKKLYDVYKALGALPGVSFFLHPCMRQSFARSLFLYGFAKLKYGGFSKRSVEESPSPPNEETDNLIRALSVSKGKPNTQSHVGLSPSDVVIACDYLRALPKNSSTRPSRVVATVLREAKDKGVFVSAADVYARMPRSFAKDFVEAQRWKIFVYVLWQISGAFEYDKTYSAFRWSTE